MNDNNNTSTIIDRIPSEVILKHIIPKLICCGNNNHNNINESVESIKDLIRLESTCKFFFSLIRNNNNNISDKEHKDAASRYLAYTFENYLSWNNIMIEDNKSSSTSLSMIDRLLNMGGVIPADHLYMLLEIKDLPLHLIDLAFENGKYELDDQENILFDLARSLTNNPPVLDRFLSIILEPVLKYNEDTEEEDVIIEYLMEDLFNEEYRFPDKLRVFWNQGITLDKLSGQKAQELVEQLMDSSVDSNYNNNNDHGDDIIIIPSLSELCKLMMEQDQSSSSYNCYYNHFSESWTHESSSDSEDET